MSLEDGLDTVSRGWGSVGRRLAGATLSLPALDIDDEAEPLHSPSNPSVRSTSNLQSSAQGSAEFERLNCRSKSKVALNVELCIAFYLPPLHLYPWSKLNARIRMFHNCFAGVFCFILLCFSYLTCLLMSRPLHSHN